MKLLNLVQSNPVQSTKMTPKKNNLGVLAICLAFSTVANSATDGAEMAAGEDNVSVTNNWQSSLAAEFSKLDKSGNGLLMRNEASKGKAFNRKSFSAADADKDGTINQEEYINYKVSKGATNQPGTASMSTDTMSSDNMNKGGTGADSMGTENTGTEKMNKDTKSTDSMGTDNMGTDNMGTDNMGTDSKPADSMGTDGMSTDGMSTDGMSTDKKGTDSMGTEMEHK